MQQPTTPYWRRSVFLFTLIVALATGGGVPLAQAQEVEPLDLGVRIDEATVDGVVSVTVTVTCSAPAGFNVGVRVVQPHVLQRSVQGANSLDGTPFFFSPHPFQDFPAECADQATVSVTVIPERGRFRAGTAFIQVLTGGCLPSAGEPQFPPDPALCDSANVVENVTLTPANAGT